MLLQVFRNDPVKGQVGKRRLTPTAGDVESENKLLNVLFDFLIVEIVVSNERSQERVKRTERLSARPFRLERAEEVDNLSQRGVKMFGRSGRGASAFSLEPAFEKLSQAPAGAVADDAAGEVVKMEIAVFVRFCNFFRVDVFQCIISDDGAGDVVEQAGVRIACVRVLVDAPVVLNQIRANQILNVHHQVFGFAHLLMLFTINNERFGGGGHTAFDKRLFDQVLNEFLIRNLIRLVVAFVDKFFDNVSRNALCNFFVGGSGAAKSAVSGGNNSGVIEIYYTTIAFAKFFQGTFYLGHASKFRLGLDNPLYKKYFELKRSLVEPIRE